MALSARDIDVHVGRRLRERRETLGVSQGRLGRHLGLTFSQVQKYEKGSNRVGAGRLFQIAEYLGVTTSHFFDGLSAGAPNGARGGSGEAGSAASAEEVRQLTAAFAAISEASTRGSVLALVRSLADEDRTRTSRRVD